MKTIFFVSLLLFVFATAYAQKSPVRFGKVDEDQLQMTSCDFFPEADAMIIAETADLYFNYDDVKGWQYTLDGDHDHVADVLPGLRSPPRRRRGTRPRCGSHRL